MDATTDDPQSATVYGDIHEAGLAIDFEQMLDTAANHLPERLQVEFGLDACDDPTAIEKVVTKQEDIFHYWDGLDHELAAIDIPPPPPQSTTHIPASTTPPHSSVTGTQPIDPAATLSAANGAPKRTHVAASGPEAEVEQRSKQACKRPPHPIRGCLQEVFSEPKTIREILNMLCDQIRSDMRDLEPSWRAVLDFTVALQQDADHALITFLAPINDRLAFVFSKWSTHAKRLQEIGNHVIRNRPLNSYADKIYGQILLHLPRVDSDALKHANKVDRRGPIRNRVAASFLTNTRTRLFSFCAASSASFPTFRMLHALFLL